MVVNRGPWSTKLEAIQPFDAKLTKLLSSPNPVDGRVRTNDRAAFTERVRAGFQLKEECPPLDSGSTS